MADLDTANADTLTSASKTDILHGDAGNDILMATNGAYELDGGAGVDVPPHPVTVGFQSEPAPSCESSESPSITTTA